MSIKVCIITPASHLEQFSSYGDCDMALSHLLVEEEKFKHTTYVKENYAKYFIKRKQLGHWVILDNSAYEIGKLESTSASGEGLGPELVLKAAAIIEPSIVIAQDILCNREATLESTKNFIKYVKNNNLQGKFQLMAVAQGKTEDEWLMSYEDLYKLPEIDQIGFSKIAVPLSFGGTQAISGSIANARLKCTELVSKTFKEPKRAHLLGGDNFLPYELSQQIKHSWIHSNDSSACIQYGIFDQIFNIESGTASDIITTKPDLENHLSTTATNLNSCTNTILHNISVLLRFSK